MSDANNPGKPIRSGTKQNCETCGNEECVCVPLGVSEARTLMPDSDLRKAVARALCRMNCDDQTYDEALSGAKAGNYHDAKALEFIHDLADAAIAVVVERCAAHLEYQAKALPVGHETPEIGYSTYNWKMHAARQIRAMARKE